MRIIKELAKDPEVTSKEAMYTDDEATEDVFKHLETAGITP